MPYTGGDLAPKPRIDDTFQIVGNGAWASLEARAEHIADGNSSWRRGGQKWRAIYTRALAHLRAVTIVK